MCLEKNKSLRKPEDLPPTLLLVDFMLSSLSECSLVEVIFVAVCTPEAGKTSFELCFCFWHMPFSHILFYISLLRHLGRIQTYRSNAKVSLCHSHIIETYFVIKWFEYYQRSFKVRYLLFKQHWASLYDSC